MDIPTPGLWTVRINSDWQGYDEDLDTVYAHDTKANQENLDDVLPKEVVPLGPYTLIVVARA